MPSNSFTSYLNTRTAKPDVEFDGEWVVIQADGYSPVVNGYDFVNEVAVPTAFPATYSHFKSITYQGSIGLYKATLKDGVFRVLLSDVKTYLPSGHYLGCQQLPITVNATTGLTELNFVFNVAGTPTAVGAGNSFRVFAVVQYGSLY